MNNQKQISKLYRKQHKLAFRSLPANYTIATGFADTQPGDIFWDAKLQKWDTEFVPNEPQPVSRYFAVARPS